MDHYRERFFAARSDAALRASRSEFTARFPGDPGALTLGEMIAMARQPAADRAAVPTRA